MSVVNIGTYPDDPSADDANVAFGKINAAFEDLGDGTISVNTAEKLKNKRTIKISGDAIGEALFDGSDNTEVKVSTKGTRLTDLATWRTAYRTSLGQAASGNFINTFSTSFAETVMS